MKPDFATATRSFQLGVQSSERFTKAFSSAIIHALEAGWHFLNAHAAHPHGTWQNYIEDQEQNHGGPSYRTVARYMQFTGLTMARLAEIKPELKAANEGWKKQLKDKTWDVVPSEAAKQERLFEAAREEILQSPVEFVALCREVGLMRAFPDYPGNQRGREQRMAGEGAQLHLNFGILNGYLGEVGKMDSLPPDRRPETPQLLDLKAKLETALTAVNSLLGSVTIDHT
jgi:hypothetical protein